METKILLSDSEALYRKCLRDSLERENDLVVVGEANDGPELLDLFERVVPNVVCVDADLHRMNGIQVTKRIRASKYNVRVILYSERIDWHTVWAAVDAGADGYICKSSDVGEFLRAIRGDTHTGCYFCRRVTAKLLDSSFKNKSGLSAMHVPKRVADTVR
jgi:DNA-binding NarL/FixJ family response regulator